MLFLSHRDDDGFVLILTQRLVVVLLLLLLAGNFANAWETLPTKKV